MYADHREDIEEVFAGDIGAVLGLKDSFTGDTLCDSSKPVILESITFPEPVISVAIEPKTTADQDKMANALSASLKKIRHFGFTRTRIQVKRLLTGWVNSIWMFWLTACCVNSACRPMSVNRALLTVKPSAVK